MLLNEWDPLYDDHPTARLPKLQGEMFRFNFSVQKRIYEYEPPFMGFRNAYLAEENAAEITAKKRKKRKSR